ncbi:hypothetical protein HDU96_001363 [Phlyctochytrium bullatum]|nr:hypothetical protein HDU96_001363 [Phlyctochytrium bullatum]
MTSIARASSTLLRTSRTTTLTLASRTTPRILTASRSALYSTVTDDMEEQIGRLQTLVADVKAARRTADESLKLLIAEIDLAEERLLELRKEVADGNAGRLVLERKAKKAEVLSQMYRIGMDLLVHPSRVGSA